MQKSLPNVEPWGCHGLFSEHYVEKRFPETEKYRKLIPPDGVWENFQALVQKNINTVAAKNEAQLEEALIRPLLRELGIDFLPAVAVPRGEVDYAFFTNEETKKAADARHYEKYKGAIALADAKRWDRPLDKGGGNDQDKYPNAVPTKQIRNYIFETGIEWGILTNGRIWRLYNRNVVPVSESYFWVNLLGALEERDTFNLFYALFSGAAFAEKAQEYVLKESESYWAGIGEDLKEKAYEALEVLCNGFRKLGPDLEIKDIYEGSVILLYRLLFILYAEDKGLLPRAEDAYRRYSLHEILKEVENGRRETFSETRPMLYDRLRHLFRLIDEGDESLGVYQYNGGLFKDEGLPFLPAKFLTDHPVPDRYLAAALKLIAFAEDKKGRGRHPVDYGELDVRHLGSIYEGLLEFHPSLKDGDIELLTDKAERKATGSYYTPGYIVDYIIENTLGPLTRKMKTPEEVLELKVLDPAMGSGHFLVGAVDFIGRRCVELAPEEAEKTEKNYQREAVERCVYGVDLNPLAVELAKLSLWLHTVAKGKPLSFLDHHLKLGNSLVGARVADLGELPKKGRKTPAPTTQNLFVDYLLGIMKGVINEVMGILGRGTEDILDIREKEILHRAAEDHLRPFKAVADTWVSTYFGNDITADEYGIALANINHPKELLALPKIKAALEMSHGDEHGVGREFFHWELEFPEVFYDDLGRAKEDPGFDAVIGNPPWGGKKGLSKNLSLLSRIYDPGEAIDFYLLFLDLNIGLSDNYGYVGMITPNTFFNNKSALKLRSFLSKRRYISELVDLPKNTFKDAPDIYPAISILSKKPVRNLYRAKKGTSAFIPVEFKEFDYKLLTPPDFYFLLAATDNNIFPVIDLVERYSDALEKHFRFQKGVETGNDKIYLFKNGPGSQNYYPWINAREFGRYHINSEGWTVKYCEELKNPQYPELRTAEKVIVQYIRKLTLFPRIVASYDEGRFFPSYGTVVSLLPKSNFSLKYLLTLLNSKLLNVVYKTLYHDIAIKASYLYKLPVRRVFFETPKNEFDKLLKPLEQAFFADDHDLIKYKVSNYLPKNESGFFLAFEEAATRVEEKSDVVHDFLAFLAQQMLDMNGEKHRVAREFLRWLDGETAGNLDDFRPKKYQEFWNYDFYEFYKWLTKNHEDFKAAGHAKLQAEFDRYKGKVVELNDKIERTDCLIDDIVYILYGLTEKEIEIVEGSFKDKGK